MFKIFGAASWLLGLPPANDVEAPQPATTFPQFRQLPPEIRDAIWRAALPPPRIYEPDTSSPLAGNPKYPTQFFRTWRPPTVREACKEAYDVCNSVGEYKYGYWGGHMRGIWINIFTDAVYFACEIQYEQSELLEVDTIYLSSDCALRSPDCRNFLMSDRFDACSRLVVAIYPPGSWEMDVETLRGTDPVFRRITDETELIGFSEWDATDYAGRKEGDGDEVKRDHPVTWKLTKEIILKLFKLRQEAAREAGRDHWEDELKLEAVEVFRKRRKLWSPNRGEPMD
ncbi:hypothetical protein CGCSCA1_v007867 [Colletotrichum siamense]|nr:hypothetical protein CGCSCA1_v007867 [Colletotrichum siamense]